ncbi:hypothetical protein DVR09_16230 (plasmid) [Erythrobacter aureus]|uniref:Uncharacterized protein n=2 Tax=Erythrobacter aureus TaxID=2182384 RepID=A0A345YJ98_9SPHN|nr:hypothetical protein DVR09_16230 [Erythrobacter aureus]
MQNKAGFKRVLSAMGQAALNVGSILDRLSDVSDRPRYAFAVLNLLVEQATGSTRVGPFIEDEGQHLALRHWVGKRLSRISGRSQRRKKLIERVREELADELPDDMFEAQKVIDAAVEERVCAAGADNFSRVLGDLEKAGFVSRLYEGYATNHANRGGLRNLVCVVDPDVSAALNRGTHLI